MKKSIQGFKLLEGSEGITLDSIWVSDNGKSILIKNTFGGSWFFSLNESHCPHGNNNCPICI